MIFKKNQRKRISLFLVMIFVLSMVTGIFPTGFLTFASGIGQTSFMNFTEIKVTDIDGNSLAEPVDKDAEVRITYYFEIPNTVNVKEGDCVSITMPAQIANIGKKISEELQDDDGNTIAYADFNTDNTIDITFTGYIEQENLGDISGSFWIQRQFENTHVGNEGETDIVFNLNGQSTYVVKVTFEKVPEITTMGITKANTYDAEKNEINWEIKVTPSTSPTPNLPIEDVVLTDLITTNQTYVIGSFNMDCSNAEGEKFISPAITEPSGSNNELKIIFNEPINTTTSEVYTIRFTTQPDITAFNSEGQSIDFKNTAKITYKDVETDSIESKEASSQRTIKADFIRKEYSYNQSNKRINWKVTINNNYFSIPPETEVKDTIPNGLTLEEDSIRLDGTPISIDNTNGPLKYSSVSGSSGGILSYVFTQAFNKPYILTYSTKVTDAEAYTSNDPKTYTNKVQLIGVNIPNNASAEIGVKASTNILKKSGIGNNTSTHEMEWQIIVNENQVVIGNPLIEDILPEGLQYIENSFKVDGSTTTEGFAYDSGANKFTYNFTGLTDSNNEINKKYTLTYKTKVLNNTVYAVNGTKGFENKAELTGNGIIKINVKANKSYTSKVITKAGKGYDYSNRIADWEIVVNDNQMEMKKAYIEDSIPEGQILVTDSVSINGNAAIKAENSIGEGYYYDEATNKLRYNFSDSIQAKQIIRFQTEVTDLSIFKENGDKTLTNKVKLYGEDIPASNTEATATQTIKSVIVSKEGRYEKGDSFIDWEVVINKNELPITNPVLRDVLQEGLELDTATVQLFELVIGKDGKYTVSDEVPLTSEHIQYTSASREFKFYFNEDITKAYFLKFQTDIASTHNNATFRNSIDFTGSHGDEENSSGDIKVAVYTSGGEASAKNGNVTIMKEDGDTGDKLSGAEFEIIDRLGIKLGDSKVTNTEGKLIFDKLKFGIPYTVKEVKAPEGYYIKEDGIRTFILSNENKAITYTAENFKIKGSIIFKKIDEQGSPVQGAVFELFKEGELNRVIQTITSSEQGVVIFEKVPYGRYIIKEKKPAQGYLAASTQLKAAVTKHDEEVYAAPEGNSDTLFALENVSIKGTLNVIKVDEANENIKLSGAVFKLFKVKGSDESYVTDLTTANNGQVELSNLAYGDYVIREIQAPKGYYINTEDHSFSIAEADTTILVTVKDKRIPIGSLVINKLDAWYGTPLEGVKFEIYNQVGERIKTESTDNKGRIEIKGLLVGTYTVKEIDTPTGYHTVNIEKTAEVKLDVSTELTIENHPLRTLVIKKTAKNNPDKVLEGAVFEISTSDATMTKEISTDTKGLAEFKDLSFGIYHIKEVKAPVGYQLLKEPLVITIDEATSPIYQIEIENLQASSGGGGGGTTPTPPEEPIEPEQPIAPEQPTPPIIEEKTPEETPVEGTIEGPEDSKAEVGEKPAHGTVTIDENGKWTYTPEPGFIGKDKFTIKIIHDDGTEEELLIEIDVEEIPLGTINLSKEDEPTEKLPKTGEGSSFGIQFLGLVLIGAGWGIKRKRAKVQNI